MQAKPFCKNIKRNIPRYKLQSRIKWNNHLQPITSYFSKIQNENSILLRSDKQLESEQRQWASNSFQQQQIRKQPKSFKNLSMKFKIQDISLYASNITSTKNSDLDKTRINLNKVKENLNAKAIQSKETRSSTKNNNSNASELKSYDVKQLEYSDYEKIVEQNQLNVKYFQAIAEKNDEIQKDKFLGGQINQNQVIAHAKANHMNSTHFKLHMKSNATKLSNYTTFKANHRSSSAADQFIVGSDRGVLSNLTIAQKILNQSIQRHKTVQKIHRYSKIKTESDIASNLNQQTEHFASNIRKKSSKIMKTPQQPKGELNLTKIPSQTCKYLLGKIFNVKHNQSPKAFSGIRVMGNSDEYDLFDRNLMRKEPLLNLRSGNLTHKSEWKV